MALERVSSVLRVYLEVSSKMPLEATMMIIDNSEYMRNGDYQENRFDAQMHAARRVHQAKADSNQESSIGIMTMAGKGYVHNP